MNSIPIHTGSSQVRMTKYRKVLCEKRWESFTKFQQFGYNVFWVIFFLDNKMEKMRQKNCPRQQRVNSKRCTALLRVLLLPAACFCSHKISGNHEHPVH